MKTIYLFFGIFLFTSIIQAQCLVGDCNNGYAIMQQQNGSYRHGFFEDSSPIGMEIIISDTFRLINIFNDESMFTVGFGMYQQGSSYVLTNNTKHYGVEFNIQKRVFNKITLSDDNAETLTRIKLKNNNVNTGCVTGNCTNGIGVYVFKDNSYYVGEFTNGKKNGFGCQRYKDTGIYYGEFVDDKRIGYGMFDWSSSTKKVSYYIGEWNGTMNGKGAYHYDNLKFEAGYYKDGQIEKVITSSNTSSKKTTQNVKNNTSNNNARIDKIKQVFLNRINDCSEITCLVNIYNSIAKINGSIEDKTSGERFTGDILKMMDNHNDGVLFNVYLKSNADYKKHFIAAAKYLSKDIREEMISKTKEYLEKKK